jgi:iduronate 2-sulfatase
MSKPFFFAVGFVKPHMPFNAPRKYWDLHDPNKLPLSKRTAPPKGAPRFSSNTCYELRDYVDFIHAPHPHDGSLSEAELRQLKHGYYACVSYMDVQVGRLIKALDDNGLSDNTIIVLWSDHGWKLGDYRSIGKMTNYEIDTACPLIIIDPRLPESRGSNRSQLVESLDLFPTLCDLADLPKPKQLDGTSLVPLLKDATLPSREAAYTQYIRDQWRQRKDGKGRVLHGIMGHAVRTGSFRYVVWRDHRSGELKAEELYDLKKDPLEMTNAINQAEYAEQLKQLRRLEVDYWPQN